MGKAIIVMFLSILNFLKSDIHAVRSYNHNFILDFISSYGYDVELHKNIETKDGYLLDMHRITNGKNLTRDRLTTKPAVFLMAGLLGSAEHWIIPGPDKSLAFLLSDLGYDVWMGNARGCYHSRKHVSMDPDTDLNFWDFSWHEIGLYDLPAMIDYVLNHTNLESLAYIGHSQGTTSFFVMASSLEDYNRKVKLMIALAPVAYMGHVSQNLLQVVSFFQSSILQLGNLSPTFEVLSYSDPLSIAGDVACAEETTNEICANVLFLICGYDSEQLNRSIIPLISKISPAGSSIKQFYHYEQCVNSGEFREYDYGLLQNMITYGDVSPPRYPLENIAIPVALFYSRNDLLAAVEDVDRLYSELKNPVLKHLVSLDKFNHLDYLWATDVLELLYVHVFKILEQFQ